MLRVRHTARPGESKAFQRMFAPDRMTLGVFFSIEAFRGDEPMMRNQERLASRAEELGFAALHGGGVHHVILNLKYGTREADEVLEEIGREILPRVREFRAADTLHHA
jgi:hypothetical protein